MRNDKVRNVNKIDRYTNNLYLIISNQSYAIYKNKYVKYVFFIKSSIFLSRIITNTIIYSRLKSVLRYI